MISNKKSGIIDKSFVGGIIMAENWVQDYIHRLFNADLVKEGKNIISEKLPYINLPLYKYCSVCENSKRTEDTIEYDIENFENDLLYFQNPVKFNDPFDCYLGFSQSQLVRDLMIQELKRQHQYTPQNREIIQTVFESSYNPNDLLDDNIDCIVQIVEEAFSFFEDDDPLMKAGQDVLLSLAKSDIGLFRRILDNKMTIYDKQKIVDLMFDSPIYQAMACQNLKNPEFAMKAARHDMKIKMEKSPNEMLYEDNGENLSIIDIVLSFASLTKGEQYSANEIDAIKKQFDTVSKDAIKQVRKVISDQFRITCLSERMDSSLMWSHYANKHYGFCLEYDFTPTLSYQPNDLLMAQLMLFPVHYSDDRPLLSKALFDSKNLFNYIKNKKLPQNTLEKLMYGLLGKSLDWSYEKEWRIFQLAKQETMKLPKARKVFLGANMEEETKQRIIGIAKKKEIPVFQMYLIADKYKFDCYRVQ